MKQPLAFRMRPKKREDILGQQHLLGENQILHKALMQQTLFSMIFYGPPGTGKTTMAMVLANELNIPYRLFNAVTGNKKELDTIFEESKYYQPLVVIIDEVHRLNKDKQDLLLPYVESGAIIMIGATTSNPTFAINPAIRSRCQLFEIKPLTIDDVATALQRGVSASEGLDNQVQLNPDAAKLIATISSGDLRYAFNMLEIASLACDQQLIDVDVIKRLQPRANSSLFKGDDGHYDALSALQKSIRGSDVDAAIYYLARLIQAQDMDSIERRLLVIAYEDVGLGNPAAVARTISAIDAAKRVGFPEAIYPLSNAVIDLALSPKSRSAGEAISMAMSLTQTNDIRVPDYLCYTPFQKEQEDIYDYDRTDLWPFIQYLPDQIKDMQFYIPTSNSSYEKQLHTNYSQLKKIKRSSNLRALKQRFK